MRSVTRHVLDSASLVRTMTTPRIASDLRKIRRCLVGGHPLVIDPDVGNDRRKAGNYHELALKWKQGFLSRFFLIGVD